MPNGEPGPSTDAGLVVCGTTTIAIRLLEELRRMGEPVSLVVTRPQARVARLLLRRQRGVTVRTGMLSKEILTKAGVATARAVAFVDDDDTGNVRAALAALDLAAEAGNRHLRVVIRIFNERLRVRLQEMFDDWCVFSAGAMSAPFFVEAAISDVRVQRVDIGRDEVVVGRPEVVEEVYAVLARQPTAGQVHLLPGDGADTTGGTDIVLGRPRPDGEQPSAGRTHHRPMWLRRMMAALSEATDSRLRMASAMLLGLTVMTFVVFWVALDRGPLEALYTTVATVATAGFAGTGLLDGPWWVQAFAAAATLSSVLLLALFTAALVELALGDRLAKGLEAAVGAVSEHVVVCGLGTVGLRVVERLCQQGVPVVGIEVDPQPITRATARRLGFPLIEGDGSEEDMLRQARVEHARCVIAVTNDAVVNLEIGMAVRSFSADLRVVLRVYDQDPVHAFAVRLGNAETRSMSEVTAPVLAAEMVAREVVAVIPAGRRALMIAELPVPADTPATDATVRALESRRPGELRIVGVVRDADTVRWRPPSSLVVRAGDRVLVAATRTGLTDALVATGAAEQSTTRLQRLQRLRRWPVAGGPSTQQPPPGGVPAPPAGDPPEPSDPAAGSPAPADDI